MSNEAGNISVLLDQLSRSQLMLTCWPGRRSHQAALSRVTQPNHERHRHRQPNQEDTPVDPNTTSLHDTVPHEPTRVRFAHGIDQPRFSVVIPAVNEAADIGRCLSSLAHQDFKGDYEVIVVDNNSTDQTAAIAHAHGATVVFEPHPGVCWARQRGTEIARGEIIVSTDADTTFDPSWLTRIEDSFRREPASVAVTGPCHFVDGPRWGLIYATLLFGLVHLLHRLTGRVFYVSATNIAFRRSAWNGYDTNLTQGGDELDVLRQLRARGPVNFDLANPTFTSARRLRRGLIYNIFVTCLYYYVLGYGLNRIFGRPVLGTAPEIRDLGTRRSAAPLLSTVAVSVAVAAAFVASRHFFGIDVT